MGYSPKRPRNRFEFSVTNFLGSVDRLDSQFSFDNRERNLMRLSASYNFFNGEEHFLASARSNRESCDHISVIYQRHSSAGSAISETALDALSDALRMSLVDDVLHYQTDPSRSRRLNELSKRNLGLDIARQRGCSHFFTIDTDEFYRNDEIERAKESILEENYLSTSIHSYFHLLSPKYRSAVPDSTNVAFITKIYPWSKLKQKRYYIKNVDSTRGLRTPIRKHHHFQASICSMFHMNLVRSNFASKFANTSTTDNDYLNKLKIEMQNWSLGKMFYFPGKGNFEIDIVENEFRTYDPMEV